MTRVLTFPYVFLLIVASFLSIEYPVFLAQAHAQDTEDEESETTATSYPNLEGADRLLKEKKYVDAVLVLRKLVKISSLQTEASIRLARALTYSGRREEALSTLWQLVDKSSGKRKEHLIQQGRVVSKLFLTNENFQLYQDGLNLLVAGKIRAAQEKLEKALALEPDNVEVLTRLGQALVISGDHDSAAERLRLAKKHNPYEPNVQLWLGRALFLRGEKQEALNELKAASQTLKTSQLVNLWLAESLKSSGKILEAVQVLEKDAKENPLHLQSILEMAKMRVAAVENGRDGPDQQSVLWSARRQLQLVLSRFPEYADRFKQFQFDVELGLEIANPTELKSQTEALLERIETKLEEKKTATT
jgi:tetratricopeptide (TPR) repeat protein